MGRKFITDLGPNMVITSEALGEMKISRYGVWASPTRNSKAHVIATGDDLDALQREHGPNLPVTKVGKWGSEDTLSAVVVAGGEP